MTKRHIKVIVALTAVVLLCVLGMICASATSSSITPALNRADLYSLATGSEAQIELSSLSTSAYYPIAVTNTSVGDQDFQYYVYAVQFENVKVALTGDYDVNLTSSSPLFRFEYNFYGKGLNSVVTLGYVSGFNLRATELLALYLPALGGWTYGDQNAIGPDSYDYEDLAYDKWLNALEGYQGVWNGTTIAERVETARQNGYDLGLEEGKNAGYASAESYYQSIQERIEDNAWQRGWNEAMDQYRETGETAYWLDIGKIITSYTDGIANIFQSVTNFELFGINVAGVFGAIIAVLVLGFVVSLLLKLFGLLI